MDKPKLSEPPTLAELKAFNEWMNLQREMKVCAPPHAKASATPAPTVAIKGGRASSASLATNSDTRCRTPCSCLDC